MNTQRETTHEYTKSLVCCISHTKSLVCCISHQWTLYSARCSSEAGRPSVTAAKRLSLLLVYRPSVPFHGSRSLNFLPHRGICFCVNCILLSTVYFPLCMLLARIWWQSNYAFPCPYVYPTALRVITLTSCDCLYNNVASTFSACSPSWLGRKWPKSSDKL